MDFVNQNILITGAADGLGLAISKSFANTKANLFLIDINYDRLIENDISNANNIQCDLSNINSVKNLITKSGGLFWSFIFFCSGKIIWYSNGL